MLRAAVIKRAFMPRFARHHASSSSEFADLTTNLTYVNDEEEAYTRASTNMKKFLPPLRTGKKGIDLIHDPLFNKGTGYKHAERDRLGLRGLVPPRRLNMKLQLEKLYSLYQEEENPLRKNIFLSELQNRNETLFFRLLIDYIEEMVYNWPCDDVQVIVVTDGSRILGLGDLGVNGMGIPIGKLALYTAAGGIDPRKVLPVVLDLGTNNETYLKDPYYLGMQHRRLEGNECSREQAHLDCSYIRCIVGEAFYSVVDEFMRAVRHRWPKALVQFEDFSSDHAADVLHAYRLKQLCFNDDIQGTGATVLAGALSACLRVNTPLKEQRILVLGAGSAGLGVSTTLLQVRHCWGMLQEGAKLDDARKRFYVFDQFGLLGESRTELTSGQQFFARPDLTDKTSLLDVIKQVKPTMILGLSAARGAFTEVRECIREMAKHVEMPIVFPLSNPTSVAECTAQQAYDWTDGRVVFASGSPFAPVTYNGHEYVVSQCNNMFIFPGVGLGAVVCGATRVTDRMLYVAAQALATCMTPEEIAKGQVFPSVKQIRKVSLKVATAVVQCAVDDGLALSPPVLRKGANLEEFVASKMYLPIYRALVE
ncbi:hypothetical protein DYB30_005876 [Aphanomyces astaci]|uniref:Malic enzyme n=1 Tax=Aphanomyces astaci TaxID=112090 RepID=A0A397D5L8_APHAT|nr:hypothetical protein DYB30_005876 [Aphanomyces astaci]